MMYEEEDSGRRRSRLWDAVSLFILVLVILLFLRSALPSDQVLMPLDIVNQRWPPWQAPGQLVEIQNELLSDIVSVIYPAKHFMVDSFGRGEFPMWNPHTLGGYPFVYNTQAALFYPLSFLYHLFPWHVAVDAVIFLQMILGAFFMFAYLRLLDLRRPAATVGALLFVLNGHMIVWLEWQVVHAAVIWLPLQLYAVEKMIRTLNREHEEPDGVFGQRSRQLRIVLLTALAFAPPWLGGHWNWSLYTTLTLLAYFLWRFWPSWRSQVETRRRRWIVTLFALTFILGTALVLVQVWPAFSYLSQSHRAPLSLWESLRSGLWDRAIMLLLPNFFGNPSHGNNWWGFDNYNESALYLGLLPLFLGLLALGLRRDTHTRFFSLWGLIGFLWTIGIPGYLSLYIFPVFNGLNPNRAVIVFVMCASVLAAMGLDSLLANRTAFSGRPARSVSMIVVGCLAVVLVYGVVYRADIIRTADYLRSQFVWAGLSFMVTITLLLSYGRGLLPRLYFVMAVFVWIVVDLFWMGYGYNPVTPVSDFYPDNAITAFLQSDEEPFRIASLGEGVVFYPNSSQIFGISNISGYEPGLPGRLVELFQAVDGPEVVRFRRVLMPVNGLDSQLLDVLNVKYIATINDWWAAAPVGDVDQTAIKSWWQLSGAKEVGQSFSVSDAGLQRIDILLRVAEGTDGQVTVRIFNADGDQELANNTTTVAEIPADGWQSFFFNPFPSEWGRDFLMTVTYSGSGTLLVGYTDDDVYPAGSRHAGGQPVAGDLAFISYYLPRPGLVLEEGKTRLYLNDNYLPRAYAVHQALSTAAQDTSLAMVLANLGHLDRLVVLETADSVPPAVLPADSATSEVTVVDYGLNEVVLQADMAAQGYVVLADSYYPGWRATLDGEETAVYRANYVLRSIAVPEGQHTIRFYFRPLNFIVGAAISGLTLVICLVGILFLTVRLSGRQRI